MNFWVFCKKAGNLTECWPTSERLRSICSTCMVQFIEKYGCVMGHKVAGTWSGSLNLWH